MDNVKINIEIPPMEIGVFAKLILKGVESPKDLLDSLVFWGLHFLENVENGVEKVKLYDVLNEAVSQMETSLKPISGFHEQEYKCIISLFRKEMEYHIYKS